MVILSQGSRNAVMLKTFEFCIRVHWKPNLEKDVIWIIIVLYLSQMLHNVIKVSHFLSVF